MEALAQLYGQFKLRLLSLHGYGAPWFAPTLLLCLTALLLLTNPRFGLIDDEAYQVGSAAQPLSILATQFEGDAAQLLAPVPVWVQLLDVFRSVFVSAVLWSVLAAGGYWVGRRLDGWLAATIVGAAVFPHWTLELIVHRHARDTGLPFSSVHCPSPIELQPAAR
ncbi:MAG TPA: hypothetical protein VEI01_11005 [Terriglobales bacterium]|nr:hypothetical protein [Terriglobales bacterium]